MRAFAWLGVWSFALGAIRAQDAALLVEHIDLDAVEATRLLSRGDEATLRAQVDRRVRDGEAKVCEIAFVRGQLGTGMRIRVAEERVYPTEWDPTELRVISRNPGGASEVEVIPSTPTAFEMRPLGHYIDVISSAEQGAASFKILSELATLDGVLKFGRDEGEVGQPLIAGQTVSGELSLRIGQSALLGAYSPEGKAHGGRTVLVFATRFPGFEGSVEEFDAGADDPFHDAEERAGEGMGAAMLSASVHFVEVGESLFRTVLALVPDRSIWELVDPAIDTGEARLIAGSRLRALNGQRARAEDTFEMIYPTEFDPPGFGAEIVDPSQIGLPEELSFEMRPVGTTFELDPVILKGGENIAVNIAPEHIEFVRMIDYGSGEARAEQPLFSNSNVNASTIVRDGDDTLVAAFTARQNEGGHPQSGRVVLAILRADIVR